VGLLLVAAGLWAGRAEPTRAVPAATATAADTAANVPTPTPIPPTGMVFAGIDGVPVPGLYYPAPRLPAPLVLLLFEKESWSAWAPRWSARGFNVLALDMRTLGPEGVSVELALKDIQDTLLVIQSLNDNPGIVPHQVAILGGSTFGGFALVACAKSPDCRTAVLFSATNYRGDLDDPIAALGNRPLFIAVSKQEGDITDTDVDYDRRARGEHMLLLYDGSNHATGLLTAYPELVDFVGDWLVKYLHQTTKQGHE
jgi:dienelactone hydrolase